MKKLLVILAALLFSSTSFAVSFTKTQYETVDGVEYKTESIIEVLDETIQLHLNSYEAQTGKTIWEQTSKWPLEQSEKGYAEGANLRTGGSLIVLTYTPEMISELTQYFNESDKLSASLKEAREGGRVACEKDFKDYRAVAVEANRSFTTVLQAICYE